MYNCEMISVVSSNVAEVGYDEEFQLLYIRFNTNCLYSYKGVPKMEYEALLNASSVGRYLARNIKNIYPYERYE